MEPRRRFRFLREIAQGGFGKVYLAEMVTGESFSSVVAIKLLHGRWLDNDEIVMRSRDEARLLGRIRHRNIVRVEDLTSINSQCAIIMEYLEGVDLKATGTWLREQNLNFPRHAIFEIISAVAAALDAAYNQSPLQGGQPLRVIHRDIKPSNCMITTEGEVKVLDFGTARATFEDREAKTQALAFGSQAYMAPERLLAEPDSPAGDVFSLGVTLYELLTLKSFGKIYLRPDKYESVLDTRLAELDAQGRSLVEMNILPEELQVEGLALLKSMLAYEPTHRPTASEVRDRMELFAEQCRDAGLKRFARERVRDIMTSTATEQDPNDTFTGTTVVEDTSSFQSSDNNSAPRNLDAKSSFHGDSRALSKSQPIVPPAPDPDSDNVFVAPPELLEPPPEPHNLPKTPPIVAEPTKSTTTSRPNPRSTTDSQPAAQPVPPIPVPDPSLRPITPKTVPPPETRPPAGGGVGKVLGGMAFVVFLGLGAVAFGIYHFTQAPPTVTPPTVATPDKHLPSGSPTPDFGPCEAGKGSIVLKVPTAVSEIELSSVTGFKAEWDGTQNLNLRNLDPGTIRSKITPANGGAAIRAEFKIEVGTTCLYTFNAASNAWEKSECR